MNIFYKKFLILGLVAAHLGAMELPNTSVSMDLVESDDLEQLPTTEVEWKSFDGAPIAAASDADVVHFKPEGNEVSGVALSSGGLEMAFWTEDRGKILVGYAGDALSRGAPVADLHQILRESDDLVDIHWIDHRLALVNCEGIILFDPHTSAISRHTFGTDCLLVARYPGYKPASFLLRNNNELVFCTYRDGRRSKQDHLHRIMIHSNDDITTVAKIPMSYLLFYSLCAASEKFTAVIKNATARGFGERKPKIKIFTTAQLDALTEKDHGVKKVVPAITHTLPRMPIDALLFSPDEKTLLVACMIKEEPTILAGLIGTSDISFVQRYAAPTRVWDMFWPALAKGPYISYHNDGKSSQMILVNSKNSNKRKTNEAENSGKIQKP